jgi:hypothetical protein
MEIREQKSPFEACGKDAVQEWLVNPVTVAMRGLFAERVSQGEKETLSAVRQYPVNCTNNEFIGASVRSMGSALLGLDEAMKLFDMAKEYANAQG